MSNPVGNYINMNDNLPQLTFSSISSVVSTLTAVTQTTAAASPYEYSAPTAPATLTASSTPNKRDAKAWENFCEELNVSPPKRINVTLEVVKGTANDILRGSGLHQADDPNSHYTWDSLGGPQKAGMAFIINEQILDCFTEGIKETEKYEAVTHGVLGINKVEHGEITINGAAIWRNLFQFVRKEGDRGRTPLTGEGAEKYSAFLGKYQRLWGRFSQSSTIFSHRWITKPVLRFQTEFSMVCAFVVSSLVIHYRQVLHPQGGATAPVDVLANDNAIETRAGNFMLNIGRYMRNELTAKQKYETIFESQGFIFEEVIKDILKMDSGNSNLTDLTLLNGIHIFDCRGVNYIYNEVKTQLKHGALCCRIQLYEDYEESTLCVKKGTKMNFRGCYHFVTIVGVSRTRNFYGKDVHGGVMFLVQDSLEEAFKNISLELLKEMNSVSHLFYIPYDEEIKMPSGSVFDMDPRDIATAGGVGMKLNKYPRPFTDSATFHKERKEREERIRSCFQPDYLPEWVRLLRAQRLNSNDGSGLSNDAADAHADTVEGGHEGVVDADTVDEGKPESLKVVEANTIEDKAIELVCDTDTVDEGKPEAIKVVEKNTIEGETIELVYEGKE